MKGAGWNDTQLLASEYAPLVPVAETPVEAPVAPKVTAPLFAKSVGESLSEDVFPNGWDTMKLDEKVAAVSAITNKETLGLIQTHKKSHWKVRNAAKYRIASL